jgi:cell wall-associated NlpC family hydrolase
MDARQTPANGVVAHESLLGLVEQHRFVAGEWTRTSSPLVDLCRTPAGPRDRQIAQGQRFLVLEHRDGWAFGQCARDEYVGWIVETSLGDDFDATHWVSAAATHLYPAADFKQREIATFPLGAEVKIVGTQGAFSVTSDGGFVPSCHLSALGVYRTELIAVASLFLGTPYLWGGNSYAGIDCSGLVQVACLSCGISCHGDSDQQMLNLGVLLPAEIALERGDLLFWQSHVAWVADPFTLLHATARPMAVILEPLADAVARIMAQGDGAVIARKRIPR